LLNVGPGERATTVTAPTTAITADNAKSMMGK
jgi:hypothetical protein